jgi:tartrate dehydratase beta subunit/fumarate hydratase class I family protein
MLWSYPNHEKDEFGVLEDFWVVRVEGFPTVMTTDSHGRSIHGEVWERRRKQRWSG